MKERKILGFPRNFWVANIVELLERWAWYGVFMVLAIYLTDPKTTGALGFSQPQKAILMGIITAFVYLAPVFTGALADRVGYKKVLIAAFIAYAIGFLAMAYVKQFILVFLAFFMVGIGAALFKPIVSATIAKTTNEKTASIGFGIFYMMVNIGAFIGPIVASKLREHSWNLVFYMAALVIIANLILVLIFYSEPQITEKVKETIGQTIVKIFRNIIEVLKDLKFVVFLILIVSFWTMYNQLFYSLPVFINHWVDTHKLYQAIYNIAPNFAQKIGTENGTINAELITNLDAMFIIIFQIFISALVKRFRPLLPMIVGITIATIGTAFMFSSVNPFIVILGIFIFSIGEMASSPKITEYIGRIAPENKKALYMGMSFLPIAGGHLLSTIISGKVFQVIADKYYLLREFLTEKGYQVQELSKAELWQFALEKLNLTDQQLTQLLWNTYNPSKILIVFITIGAISVIGLWLYDRFMLKSK